MGAVLVEALMPSGIDTRFVVRRLHSLRHLLAKFHEREAAREAPLLVGGDPRYYGNANIRRLAQLRARIAECESFLYFSVAWMVEDDEKAEAKARKLERERDPLFADI